MTSKGPEKRFRDALKRSFDSTYGKGKYFWKSIPGGIHGGGWPDVYVAFDKRALFLEFKVSPNKPTSLQAQVITQLDKHNARSAAWIVQETPNLAFLYFVGTPGGFPIRRESRVWDVKSIMDLANRSM